MKRDFEERANTNPEGLPKYELLRLIKTYNFKPGLALALFIATGALAHKTTWTGTEYAEHYLRVGDINSPHLSLEEKIVGILHDVVEDSDWEIEDLEAVGFSHRICEAVRSVTKIEGEKYLDASKRASLNPLGRRVKPRDNKDNMDLTRSYHAATDKQKYLYHISHTYLTAVEHEEIPPGLDIWKFLRIEKYANLINKDNAEIIARNTSDLMPEDFRKRFGLPLVEPAAP